MIEPTKVIDEGENGVTIEWSDDRESSFGARQLRIACPCAGCVDEWTGEKTLNQDSVPGDLSISSISIVGRYALNFHFSDGHETGIFSFKYLRDLAERASDA